VGSRIVPFLLFMSIFARNTHFLPCSDPSSISEMLQGCYKGVTMVLQWRYKDVTRVLQECCNTHFLPCSDPTSIDNL
jgi:hypothetical protein